jgi:hypothetical protein
VTSGHPGNQHQAQRPRLSPGTSPPHHSLPQARPGHTARQDRRLSEGGTFVNKEWTGWQASVPIGASPAVGEERSVRQLAHKLFALRGSHKRTGQATQNELLSLHPSGQALNVVKNPDPWPSPAPDAGRGPPGLGLAFTEPVLDGRTVQGLSCKDSE